MAASRPVSALDRLRHRSEQCDLAHELTAIRERTGTIVRIGLQGMGI
jgi:hypothetical protein